MTPEMESNVTSTCVSRGSLTRWMQVIRGVGMDVAVAVGAAVGDIVDVIVTVRVDVAVPVGKLVAVAVRPVGVAVLVGMMVDVPVGGNVEVIVVVGEAVLVGGLVGVGVGATTPSMSICSKRGVRKWNPGARHALSALVAALTPLRHAWH